MIRLIIPIIMGIIIFKNSDVYNQIWCIKINLKKIEYKHQFNISLVWKVCTV